MELYGAFMYTGTQVHRYTGTQVHMYICTQVVLGPRQFYLRRLIHEQSSRLIGQIVHVKDLKDVFRIPLLQI